MSDTDFLLLGIRDPRLAVHATSALPAWLWSIDGSHILWTNGAGARLFNASNAAALAQRTIGPADQHRRQAAQLAARLPPSDKPRLEKLRGFGAPLGTLLTCACARIVFSRRAEGLLIAAAQPVGRTLRFNERLAHLVDGVPMPAMTFTSDGALAGTNDAGKSFAGQFNGLTGPGFDDARASALRNGQSILKMDIGRVSVHRVGSGAETALVALIDAVTVPKQRPKPAPEVLQAPAPPVQESTVIEPAVMGSEAATTNTEPVASALTSAPALEPVHESPAIETTAETPPDRTASEPRTATPVEVFTSAFDEPASSEPPASALVVDTQDNFPATESNPPVDTPKNVVPFPSANEPKPPVLTAGESNAFDELARRLSAQLGGALLGIASGGDTPSAEQPAEETATSHEPNPPEPSQPASQHVQEAPAPTPPPQPATARANSLEDPQLLDRLPLGVLVYRLDRLLYANRAFLDFTGHAGLHELTAAGGLDVLFVEAGAGAAASATESGTEVTISAHADGSGRGEAADARLFAISWDGEPAHALILSAPGTKTSSAPVAEPEPAPIAAPRDDTTASEEFSIILDATSEGVVVFDGEGRLLSCNRAAEILFGRDDRDITTHRLIDLFAPESQHAVLDYLESVRTADVTSLVEHGRDVLGRTRDGDSVPLAMKIGRTRHDGTRFFAILRDLSQTRKIESELLQVRRQVERLGSGKADILSRISHEVRMPLNAIIGFADMMIAERFGALGNERYAEYLKDIRASGQRVITIIDDLLDLSRIESGKMDLSFANQDLNNMVEQCVAVMQPQANRERIIIRTSLAHSLPTVKADARALRQIALNLIGNSIHLANAGGQVIVSTATTDFGDIVLRVRDTGPGLNDNEIAAAMAPFRTPGASDMTENGSVVNLSLTKALVEANRAQFHIKTAPHSGTLIEVVFSHASAIA